MASTHYPVPHRTFASSWSVHRWLLAFIAWLVACGALSWGGEIEGFTEPYRDIDVAAGEMGEIAELSVMEGDRVRAGQMLARLDESVLQASLDIAKAARDARGRVESARAELDIQQEMLRRLRELLTRQHATQQEIDRAVAQTEVLDARLRAAEEELAVRALEVTRAEVQLQRRRLTSPIDGVVTRVFKDVGEFVSPNDPVVVKVVQLDPLLAVFSVPTASATGLRSGQQVELRIDRAPATGEIEFVSPTTEAESGTKRVRVRIANPEERLPSGVDCRLLLPDAVAR